MHEYSGCLRVGRMTLFSQTEVFDPGNTFKNWGQMCTSWVNL